MGPAPLENPDKDTSYSQVLFGSMSLILTIPLSSGCNQPAFCFSLSLSLNSSATGWGGDRFEFQHHLSLFFSPPLSNKRAKTNRKNCARVGPACWIASSCLLSVTLSVKSSAQSRGCGGSFLSPLCIVRGLLGRNPAIAHLLTYYFSIFASLHEFTYSTNIYWVLTQCRLLFNGGDNAKQGQSRPILRGQAVVEVCPEVTVIFLVTGIARVHW